MEHICFLMFTRPIFKITIYVLFYYIFSLTLGFFTSHVLSKKEYNFRFPLFITSMQNLIHFLLANCSTFLFAMYNTNSYIPSQQKKRKYFVLEYFMTTVPCAATAAVDIGISSYSLRIVSLAFYTMVKSSSPVFILLSGFVFGIEKPSIIVFLIIFTIGVGVFLTSMTNTVFDGLGFSLISLASFMAGFRWAFVQFLIEKRKVKRNGLLNTIKDLCLPISIILFIFSLIFEGFKDIVTSEFFSTKEAIKKNILFILLSGFLSFFLLCSEFLLVSKTSVVFLSVIGIVKELMIVVFSVFKKNITLNTMNWLGLFISSIGIIMYNIVKRKKIEL